MHNQITYAGRSYGDGALESVSMHTASGLFSLQLEADTLTAVVRTEDKSITRFDKNEPIQYTHRGRVRFRGFLQSVDREGQNLYSLTAASAIGLLTERNHPGGIYTGQTAERVIKDICGDLPVLVKSNIKDIPLYGWLPYAKPPKSSARDNLCQVLFALGATVRADADGVLRVFILWDGASGAAPEERIYEGASVEYEGAVSALAVTEHQYMQGGEEAALFEGTASNGDVVEFPEPMYDLKAAGFRLLSHGDNHAVLSAGTGTLTGRKYIHSTRQVIRSVWPGVPENVKSITDPTLVSLTNSNAAATRLAAYYKCREVIENGVALKQQDAGDLLRAYHPYDRETVSACVESMDVNGSGILKADMKLLVGYEPPQPDTTEFFSSFIVVTKSGTVTLPEGTVRIRAVLIGGGEGGEGGTHGTAGTAGGLASITRTRAGGSVGKAGEPGKGGAAGKGGKGGNIAIFDIDDPGPTLQIKLGPGAQGGPAHPPDSVSSPPPPTNPHTYLYTHVDLPLDQRGVYSSVDGSPSDTGYYEPMERKTYARPGAAGIDGGDGGEAGSGSFSTPSDEVLGIIYRLTTTPGKAGGDAASYSGGKGAESYFEAKYTVYEDTYYYPTAETRVSAGSVPSGGGGAANGENGGSPSSVTKNAGGKGGKAAAPAPSTVPGSGGNGGNGGGGGGAGGAGYVGANQGNQNPGPEVTESSAGAAGGAGGEGSDGTNGASGCAIIYYSQAKTMQRGALMDSKGRFVLDALGRLIVF